MAEGAVPRANRLAAVLACYKLRELVDLRGSGVPCS